MRTPPLLADFIHTRVCKPICEKLLTVPGKKVSCFITLHHQCFDDAIIPYPVSVW